MAFSRKAISLRSPAFSSAYLSISWNETGGVFPDASRHILRGQRENERSGIGRPGSVDQAELAADVALYVEQFKPLRHLALCHSIALATHSASARLLPKVQASIAP